MPKLFEMKQDRIAALDAAEKIIASAEAAQRPLTATETRLVDERMAEASSLNARIEPLEARSTLRAQVNAKGLEMLTGGTPNAEGLFGGISGRSQGPNNPGFAGTRTPGYMAALHAFIKTGGKAHGDELTAGTDGTGRYHLPGSEQYTMQRLPNGTVRGMSAAMYEGVGGGSNGAGGFAVSIPTVPEIVPLALPDLGIFDAASVVATATDVKIPQQASFGTSSLKAESNGTIATFGGTDPTLGQITLSAYMAGALRLVSWELMQDVSTFQQFVVDDIVRGQRILEGSLLATGTGVGQPLGAFGNTGTGTGTPYALSGASTDGLVLLDSLFDVMATLKSQYQANASWIMSRATGHAIRRAQMQNNLFVPVATVDADGTERILGKPVFYDVNAPALPAATTSSVIPILYGDFKAGYLVGVRGGGINVKILDQPWAAQGQLGVLAYRRLDGRVCRSEAIQAVTFSHA